jgi:hypothetical protein
MYTYILHTETINVLISKKVRQVKVVHLLKHYTMTYGGVDV